MTDIHPKQLENVARAIASADYDTEYRPDYGREGFIESAWPSYKEQAEAAIRAAARPLPIEDAPRDGRFLLINGMKNGDFCEAKWFSKHNVWKIRNGNFVCNEAVTGWLPIPPKGSE